MNTSPTAQRRKQMLEALDIDVWQVRRATSTALDTATEERPRSVAAASAALKSLEQAKTRSSAAGSQRSAAATDLPASPIGATDHRPAPDHDDAPVNLWCLSGPHGVMLANLTGLSPQSQRLLNDIFQAAMRIVAGESATKKLKLQKLHFNWPPSDSAVGLGSSAPTGRALRGFLSRQLQDKADSVILYAAAELQELLERAQPAVSIDRRLYVGDPETLLTDSSAKRALWLKLNRL